MNDKNELAVMAPSNAVVNATQSFMDMIQRGMTDPAFDADKLDRMLAANERFLRVQAEIEFTQALARMKPKLPKIAKNGAITFIDKNNIERRTPHARYEDIQKAIEPFLSDEGFSLSFDTEFQANQPTIIKCTLAHKGGHTKTISMPLTLDSSGSKNNLQAMGSTIQYGRRYLVVMMFDLVIEGKDNDGDFVLVDEDQVAQLEKLLKTSGLNKKRWLEKSVKVPELTDIKASDYVRCVNSLKAIIHDNAEAAKGAK